MSHQAKHQQAADGADTGRRFESRTAMVVILTALAMVAEILFGYYTRSMALLTDGWHMASHVLALGLSWAAYAASRKYGNSQKIRFSRQKLLALSGFTSALLLLFIAVYMAWEAVGRILNPISIRYSEALIVAAAGLLVNGLSAWILHFNHKGHDHNIRAAYLHVLADGITSIAAIVAITAAMWFDIVALDSASGILSSLVITRWALGLIRTTGRELIDFQKA